MGKQADFVAASGIPTNTLHRMMRGEDGGTYQAFGVARLPQSEFEMGYICIDEFHNLPVEVDLHFAPTPLKDIAELKEYVLCNSCDY